jgi:hypothetical protein
MFGFTDRRESSSSTGVLRLVEPFGRCAPLSCSVDGPATTSCSGVRRMRLILPSLDNGGPEARLRSASRLSVVDAHRSVATSLSQLALDSRSTSTYSFPGDLLSWRASASRLPASLIGARKVV